MHFVGVFLGHDVAHLGEELKFSELVHEVAIDVAAKDGHLVTLDHGLVSSAKLLCCGHFKMVLLIVNYLERSVGTP